MFKNRILVVLSVLSLLLVTVAVSNPFSGTGRAEIEGANDFYQRHPDWVTSNQNVAVPVTGSSESPDYFQRHPELRAPVELDLADDFYQRHPGLRAPVETSADTSDYFLRHTESRTSAGQVDLSDYFLRHPELRNP